MITAKLWHGMGNQMFQYAAARRLAEHHGTRLRLDVGWYGTEEARDPLRCEELGHFKLMRGARRVDDPWALSSFGPRAARQRRRQERTVRYQEPHQHFDGAALALPADAYLLGYFQSERYFADIADTIRRDLTFRAPLSAASQAVADRIAATNAVSLHVRRTDYVGAAAESHGALELDYYRRALALTASRVPNASYFVFSDDPGWTREHLAVDGPVTYVTHNGAVPHEDLHLMSLCRHNVIANSTFSWWGAWLGDPAGRTVIAPARWYRSDEHDTSDVVPSRWITLPAGREPIRNDG